MIRNDTSIVTPGCLNVLTLGSGLCLSLRSCGFVFGGWGFVGCEAVLLPACACPGRGGV